MSYIKVNIENDGLNNYRDLSLLIEVPNFQFDLVYCDNNNSDHYFKLFSKDESLKKGISQYPEYSWNQPIIDFHRKSTLCYNKLTAKSISELALKMEIAIIKDVLKWNKDFILSLCQPNKNIFFQNELIQNDYTINCYKEPIIGDSLWYNRFHLAYKDESLNRLDSLKIFINAIRRDMISYEDIPTIDNIPEPKISFIDKLFGDSKRIMTEYNKKIDHVNNLREQIEARNKEINEANITFSQSLSKTSELLESKLNDAKLKKEEFKNLIDAYESGNLVEDFITSAIENSDIKNLYNLNFDAYELNSKNHFACDISLPNDLQISKIKSYKEYKRDGRIESIFYSDRDFKKVYDLAIYSIFFRVIREIFLSDYCSNIQYLNINGWVNVINKKNGQYENRCIMSLAISRDYFLEIDFENVDLKAAFKNLKGITTTSLLDFIPVAPIINTNKRDKRFIQSNEVLKNINESINLAAISWEDFEHLVRELFEREFSDNGGEVKVTQSSRDGGVDAVAFDPDPIRGGKIVIQSKRYTNVVGVSAIRDLYGTVLNEGATKGIIITTSHYGNDAYEFAKGKPLTLLDGNNLLFLLEKHGFKARIDTEEAKKLSKDD